MKLRRRVKHNEKKTNNNEAFALCLRHVLGEVLVFTFSGQAQKAEVEFSCINLSQLSSVIINIDGKGKDGKHICVMPRTRCQVLNRSARSKAVQGVELQKGDSCWSYLALDAHGVQVASLHFAASLHQAVHKII